MPPSYGECIECTHSGPIGLTCTNWKSLVYFNFLSRRWSLRLPRLQAHLPQSLTLGQTREFKITILDLVYSTLLDSVKASYTSWKSYASSSYLPSQSSSVITPGAAPRRAPSFTCVFWGYSLCVPIPGSDTESNKRCPTDWHPTTMSWPTEQTRHNPLATLLHTSSLAHTC